MEDINEEGKYKITYTGQFKKDYKKYKGNKTKILKVVETISLLEEGGVDKLPKSMKAHFPYRKLQRTFRVPHRA